ncbi:MAG TPA: hypothetical protein VM123_00535 [archaeon]|nr:hypothetical protein [archaeon]
MARGLALMRYIKALYDCLIYLTSRKDIDIDRESLLNIFDLHGMPAVSGSSNALSLSKVTGAGKAFIFDLLELLKIMAGWTR